MHILEGEGVTKYFGGLAAVSDVDFHVDQGEIVGLIGPMEPVKQRCLISYRLPLLLNQGAYDSRAKRLVS